MIRYSTIMAGVAGFIVVCLVGLLLDRDWERVIISAAVAALAFGLVAQWWMVLWVQNLVAAQEGQARLATQQAQAAEKEIKEQEESQKPAPGPVPTATPTP